MHISKGRQLSASKFRRELEEEKKRDLQRELQRAFLREGLQQRDSLLVPPNFIGSPPKKIHSSRGGRKVPTTCMFKEEAAVACMRLAIFYYPFSTLTGVYTVTRVLETALLCRSYIPICCMHKCCRISRVILIDS